MPQSVGISGVGRFICDDGRLEIRQPAAHTEDHPPEVNLQYGDAAVEDVELLGAPEGPLDVNALPGNAGSVLHLLPGKCLLLLSSLGGHRQGVKHVAEGLLHHEPLVRARNPKLVNGVDEPAEARDLRVRDAPRVRRGDERESAVGSNGTEELEGVALLVLAPHGARHRLVARPLHFLLMTIDEG